MLSLCRCKFQITYPLLFIFKPRYYKSNKIPLVCTMLPLFEHFWTSLPECSSIFWLSAFDYQKIDVLSLYFLFSEKVKSHKASNLVNKTDGPALGFVSKRHEWFIYSNFILYLTK